MKVAQSFDQYLKQALNDWGKQKKWHIYKTSHHSTTQRIEHMLDVLLGFQLARSRDIIE